MSDDHVRFVHSLQRTALPTRCYKVESTCRSIATDENSLCVLGLSILLGMEANTWLAAVSSDFNKAAIAALVFLICGVGIASRFRGGDSGKGAAFVVYVDERSNQTRREGARKRWLWDSLNLLREGYAKVQYINIISSNEHQNTIE